LIVTAAVFSPKFSWRKVTVIVHDSPAAKVEGASGQSFVCSKSAALAPVTAMLEIVNGPVRLLVKVAIPKLLGVPRSWSPKASSFGCTSTGVS